MLERQTSSASPAQLRDMVVRMPGSAIVQYHFARSLEAQGDLSGAVPALEQARRDDPSSARVVTLLADVMERQARFAEAGALVEDFARSHPQSGEAHYALGVYLYRVFARSEAIRELQHSVQLAPTETRPWRVLGEAYLAMNRFPEAASAYSKALEIEPGDSPTRIRRGAAYRAMQDLSRAETDTRAAVRLTPRSPEARFALAELLERYRATPAALREAEPILRSLLSDDTLAAESHRALGQLLSTEGRWLEASSELAAYVAIRPEDSNGLYLYAAALHRLGSPDSAIVKRFRTAKASEDARRDLMLKVQGDPKNVDLRLKLGRLLAGRGETALAIFCYERALRLDPGNTTARQALTALRLQSQKGSNSKLPIVSQQ
jgi:tetratricopeptide (TPR) repeat protein